MDHRRTHIVPRPEHIRKLASMGNITLSRHALQRAMERSISVDEIQQALSFVTELIEEYPHDARGHSCLVRCYTESGDPFHCVCAIVRRGEGSRMEPHVVVITVYRPRTAEED